MIELVRGTEVDGFCSFVGGSAGAIAASSARAPRSDAPRRRSSVNVGIDEVNGRPPTGPVDPKLNPTCTVDFRFDPRVGCCVSPNHRERRIWSSARKSISNS